VFGRFAFPTSCNTCLRVNIFLAHIILSCFFAFAVSPRPRGLDQDARAAEPRAWNYSGDAAGDWFQGQDLADLIRQQLESSSLMLAKLDPLI
jgi:hypothetical protein